MKKMIKIFGALFIPILIASCAMNERLHLPASAGDMDKVRTEIEGGRDVDSKDAAGQTALMYAAENGRIEVVKYLVSKGADVDAIAGGFGRGTALIYAASTNRLEVISYLIKSGADVNAVTKHNETALVWATAKGHLEAAKLLLENGADITIKNKKDQTAIDIARELNREKVLQLLESW
ncbi:MAG: hypothetical protein GY935_13460 [Gammaproteobacteria bacterium]|nr:hypothetical protein [Gammaproteobacteria bacterium]